MAKSGYGIVHRLTAAEIVSQGTALSGGFIEEVDSAGLPTGRVLNTGLGGQAPADVQTSGNTLKNNLAATVDPVATDDSNGGYSVGSHWVNVTSDESFICVDASVGAAVWSSTTVGTIGEVAGLQTQLDGKASLSTLTTHTTDTSNPHTVTKGQVGLGVADNTSDVDKPVSTAQQTALDLKVTGGSWTSYTPTITAGSGTFTNVSATGKYRISDGYMDIGIQVNMTGALGTGNDLHTSLPAGFSIDSVNLIGGGGWGTDNIGQGVFNDTGTLGQIPGFVMTRDVNRITMKFYSDDGSSYAKPGQVTASTPFLFANGDSFIFSARFPVV